MMKLVLLVLFCTFYSVQSTVTTPNGKTLIYVGNPITLVCNKPNAIWKLNARNVSTCNCPSSGCKVMLHKTRITAFCNGSSPVLHFNSTEITDNGYIKCSLTTALNFGFNVGRNAEQFHPENKPFALVNNTYTLVCSKTEEDEIKWFDEKRLISVSYNKCTGIVKYGPNNYNISCDKSKSKLLIKQVTLSDDGKMFGCYAEQRGLLLLNITVNVPVTSVSLQSPNKYLFEDENLSFVCKVESKPEADFKWTVFQEGSPKVIRQNSTISKERNGKLWQTTSTLILKLERTYDKIMCSARIKDMAWKNSTPVSLDIKYPPPGKPIINGSKSTICAGEEIIIKCQWPGGYPDASVNLTCLSKVKTKISSVSITETVTREINRTCSCEGRHFMKNAVSTYDLNLHYPPNKVVIYQTSYLRGTSSHLICNASGGYPNVYNYSWSPGNYPSENKIKINLTQVSNQQEITCTVVHECTGNNPASSTIKLIVEDYPIIKMEDNIKVIENMTIELNCLTEGNPKPTNKWKIGGRLIKSKLLKVSFTRHNASAGIQCIAIANSTKHGILKSVKNISILVIYPPEIMISHHVEKLHETAEIICEANASPNNTHYTLVQKWGTKVKRQMNGRQVKFDNFSFQDLGTWICQASNGVPNTWYYTEKSVEMKVNVPAQFEGEKITTAIVGSEKRCTVCFYCYPEATAVKWYKENEEISSDKSVYVPAENGVFPFTGNCSILKLDITEKTILNYYLKVTNYVGQETFTLTIVSDIEIPNVYVIVFCTIAVTIIFIIIGGIGFVKYRRYSKKKQSNKNLVGKNNSTNVLQENESIYDSLFDNVDQISPNKKISAKNDPMYVDMGQNSPKTKEAKPMKDIYENLEMEQKKVLQDNVPMYVEIVPNSPNKKVSEKNDPMYVDMGQNSPKTKEAKPTKDIYENLEMEQKKEAKPTKDIYENLEMEQKKD